MHFWFEPDGQDLLGWGDIEPLGKRGRNVNAKPLGYFVCPGMKGVSAAHGLFELLGKLRPANYGLFTPAAAQ